MNSALSEQPAGLRERLREFFSGPSPEKFFRRTVAVSVGLHAIAFAIMLSGSLFDAHPQTRSLGPAVSVSLLDLPLPKPKPVVKETPVASAPEAEAAKPAAETAAVEKSAGAPVAETRAARDALYLKRLAKEEELARLKREEEARQQEEENQRASEREKLLKALASLKSTDAGKAASSRPKSEGRTAEEIEKQLAEAARGTAALQTAEGMAGVRFGDYRTRLQAQVERGWRVPANLARRRDLVAVVEFEIEADGTIRRVQLDKSSGEAAYDDSVMRAARDITSFETPPVGFPRTFTIRFVNRDR